MTQSDLTTRAFGVVASASPTEAGEDLSVADVLGPLKARTNYYATLCRVKRRRLRVKDTGMAVGSTCFHLMSRTCGGAIFFDETEKEGLVLVMKRMAAFCGIKLLTYCVMGNHFHALVRVPKREIWLKQFEGAGGEQRLMEHLKVLYSKGFRDLFQVELANLRKDGREAEAQQYLEEMKARFCDVSVYAREVKTRFCRWYNKRHGRRGTVWMERFRSVIVEGKRGREANDEQRAKSALDALKVMAAYIDLNPVRAGMVERAKDYRWSGWGAALTGEKLAMEGLCDVTETVSGKWESAGKVVYARWLGAAEEEAKREFRIRKAEAEEDGGESPQAEIERAKEGSFFLKTVRAFTRGVAVGSEAFVEAIFQSHRPQFGPRRESGGRHLDGNTSTVLEGLRTLRDLRRRR